MTLVFMVHFRLTLLWTLTAKSIRTAAYFNQTWTTTTLITWIRQVVWSIQWNFRYFQRMRKNRCFDYFFVNSSLCLTPCFFTLLFTPNCEPSRAQSENKLRDRKREDIAHLTLYRVVKFQGLQIDPPVTVKLTEFTDC